MLCINSLNVAWVCAGDNKNYGEIYLCIAVEYLHFVATDRRLGSCLVCNYDVKTVMQLLPMDEDHEAVSIVSVGYVAPDFSHP